MDVTSFARELLSALANVESVEQVSLQTAGPVVKGRAQLREGALLSFYFNQETGTQAFALVEGNSRVWGIDYDNLRGWHLHPANAPDQHMAIEPKTVSAIVEQLRRVLKET